MAEEFGEVADDVFRSAILRLRRAPAAPSNLIGAIWAAIHVEKRERRDRAREMATERSLDAPDDAVSPDRVKELVTELANAMGVGGDDA